MKIKDGYVIAKVADSYIVMSVGSSMHLSGLTTLNETGAFIWNCLQKDTDEASIVKMLCGEFEIDAETARKDTHDFVQTLKNADLLV